MSTQQRRTVTIPTVEQFVAGNSLRLPFTVPDHDSESDADRVDLTNATIRWALLDYSDTRLLDLDDPGVSLTLTDPAAGEFRVDIEAGTTDDLNGRYTEWIELTTSHGDRQTWIGGLRIRENKLR